MRYGANSNETTPNNKYMAKVVQKGNKFDPIYTKIKIKKIADIFHIFLYI
jgi:hypothetical protein